MTGLPKKYAKMGFKKGWKAFKKTNRFMPTTKKSIKTITRSRRMTKKKTYKKSSSMFGRLNRPLTGAAGVVLYESLISPMIPLQGVAKDMLELVSGIWLSKKKGIVGATGQSLVVINSYQILSGLVGNKLQGLIGNIPTSEYDYANGVI